MEWRDEAAWASGADTHLLLDFQFHAFRLKQVQNHYFMEPHIAHSSPTFVPDDFFDFEKMCRKRDTGDGLLGFPLEKGVRDEMCWEITGEPN